VAAILGIRGDGFHDLEEEADLVQKLRDTAYLVTATRGISEEEREKRKKASHKRWHRNNAARLQEKKRAETRENRVARKMAKRAAQIAVHYREKLSNSYLVNRSTIYQKLYSGHLTLDGGIHPLELLDSDNPPTESSFPLMVCVFLPNCDWPKVVPAADILPQMPLPLLVNQIPGIREYRRLQMLLHPDRAPRQGANAGRGGGSGRERLNRYQPFSRQDILLSGASGVGPDRDCVVMPDTKLSSFLNAAWDLWKDTVTAPQMQSARFSAGTDSEQQFALLSPTHKHILQLFSVWMDTSENILHSIIPTGVSVLELHHFINADQAQSPVVDSDDHNSTNGEDEDGIKELAELLLLRRALHVTDPKPAGRPHQERPAKDEEDEEDEDEEDEDDE
jgi:hypothetical protein